MLVNSVAQLVVSEHASTSRVEKVRLRPVLVRLSTN
jgi:hypothetical protein